jgi:hypothetical protein
MFPVTIGLLNAAFVAVSVPVIFKLVNAAFFGVTSERLVAVRSEARLVAVADPPPVVGIGV